MILGLDISTSSTGICIVNKDQLEYCAFFSPSGDDIFSKIESITCHLDELCKKYLIEKIYIEEPLIAMSQKFQTSAEVLKLLIRFNFAINYHLYKTLNIKPIYVPFSSARRILNLKNINVLDDSLVKLTDVVHKDKISGCQHVMNLFPSFRDKMFMGKNLYSKGKYLGLPKNCVFDCSDAVIIALAGDTYVRETSDT